MQVLAVSRSTVRRRMASLSCLCDGLLDRIDGNGGRGLGFDFALGRQDVFDDLFLKQKDVLIPDVPGLVRQAGNQLSDFVAVFANLVGFRINVSREMPLP